MTRGERECFPNPPGKAHKNNGVSMCSCREEGERTRSILLECYTARNTSHGTPPLDRTQLFTDGRVQDHAALPGQRPSVPSSRPDAAIANQNNTLSWVQALF
eukprot:1153628-Pelagomonas_calceolata.AAC.4